MAKANPGSVAFASSGSGSAQHLAGELFRQRAGVDMTHIPYKGGGPALNDVIGGQVDVLFDSVTVARSQVQGGRLRVLGITSKERNPLLPDAEPVAATVPGYEVLSWTALAAPKGLPAPVLDRLAAA